MSLKELVEKSKFLLESQKLKLLDALGEGGFDVERKVDFESYSYELLYQLLGIMREDLTTNDCFEITRIAKEIGPNFS